MKKVILLTLLISIGVIILHKHNIVDNYYNYFTGYIHCQSKPNCFHESAHKYDDKNEMISESQEWIRAIDDYRMTQFYMPQEHKVKQAFEIMFFPGIGTQRIPSHNIFSISFWQGGWGGYSELYAHLAECSDGDINNIPESLRKFYNMNAISNIMKEVYHGILAY